MYTKKNNKLRYYRYLNGKKLNRDLLNTTIDKIELTNNKIINTNIINKLLNKLIDSNKITDVEKNTINYLKNKYEMTNNAKKYL